jgi:hypothetical protein
LLYVIKNSELKSVSEILDTKSNISYEKSSRLHTKKYTTVFGQLKLKRYCYQPKNREKKYDGSDNIYPLDVKVSLPKHSYSYFLQEIISLASNNQSFKQASAFIKKLFSITIGVDAIEKITQDITTPFNDFFNTLIPISAKKDEIVVVSADGKGVPVTKEESKNIKDQYLKKDILSLLV